MYGINLDKKIEFHHASFRYFDPDEYHITRVCEDDVIVMVFEGKLIFTEDEKDYEITSGNYHIQKHGSCQMAKKPSESPKYLYVHFYADWCDREIDNVLSKSGTFSYSKLKTTMEKLDALSHNGGNLTEQNAEFYKILSLLYNSGKEKSVASEVAEYIADNCNSEISLASLSERFHFSKNHLINIFKKEYNTTPGEYLINARVKKAEWLLEVTSKTSESIAYECGFSDYSHFYKMFKKRHFMSPNEWRNKKRMGLRI